MSQSKRVGIVGPTNVPLIEEKAGLPPGTLEKAAREVGVFLADQSLGMACVPVQGVPLWALEAYKQAGGVDSLALWPRLSGESESSTTTTRGNPGLADRVNDKLTWGDEPFELAKSCDCLVVIGLSCGTMVEMAATKWVKATPALVVSSLVTHIPVEVASELDIRYCDNIASLEAEILKIVA